MWTIIQCVILFYCVESSMHNSTNITEEMELSVNSNLENATCDFMDNTTCEEFNSTLTTPDSIIEEDYNSSFSPVLSAGINEESRKKYVATEICTCDLQEKNCDINCCCDEDCTDDDKEVFKGCDTDPNRFYDTRYCKYSMFIYKNNTPYEWQVNQNGLFCIIKSNLPPEYSEHDDVQIYDDFDAKFQKINKYHWKPMEVTRELPEFQFNKTLRFGDYIWIVRNKTTLEVLEIPTNFEGTANLQKIKVKFLENVKTRCMQISMGAQNRFLDINTFLTNISVVSFSKTVDIKKHVENCPKSSCIPIEAKICDSSLEYCNNISDNMKQYSYFCNFSSHTTYTCKNLLKKLQYTVYHNGTNGINKVEVAFALSNESFSSQALHIEQEFEVFFKWMNTSNSFSGYNVQRSGNPGYIVGKPILLGYLEYHFNGLKNLTKRAIKRNPNDMSTNFLILPQNENLKCVLNNKTNTIVEFGYNMIFTCKIIDSMKVETLKAEQYCQDIQKKIFYFWSLKEFNDNCTRVFGKFGNADANKVDDWANVSFPLTPKKILSDVKGNFTKNNQKLNCQNLYDVVKIDIFHARNIIKNLHHQEKIVWLMVSFENKSDHSLNIRKGVVYFEFYLRSEIMFYDVTTKKSRRFAEPPRFEIKLPYDFFYPFVKIDSKCNRVTYMPFLYFLVHFIHITVT